MSAPEINIATIKGSPHTYHLKQAGMYAALCGRKPGEGYTSMGRKRTGWYVYREVNAPDHLYCRQCLGAASAVGVKVEAGHVVATSTSTK